MARPRPAALAFLAVCLVAAAGRAAAQEACQTVGLSAGARYYTKYLPSSAKISPLTNGNTERTYCFAVGKRTSAAPSSCTAACCEDGARLTGLTLTPGGGCSGGALAKRAVWRLGAKRVTPRVNKDGSVTVPVPAKQTWDAEANLCVTFTEVKGAAAGSCLTINDACGSPERCLFTLGMSGPASRAAKPPCCTAFSVAAFDPSAPTTPCDPGTGGATCAPCARGSYSAGGSVDNLRPDCTSCPDGTTTLSAGATAAGSCVSVPCDAGYGGPNCAPCARGTYSGGGSADNPRPACFSCPAGFTTPTFKYGVVIRDCNVPICPSGMGGTPGGQCKSCMYGTYSAGGDANNPQPPCLPCPGGTYTTGLRSRTANDCVRSAARACLAGFALIDGACHICPVDTYSPGGTTAQCAACPGRSVTNGIQGATSVSTCVPPTGMPDGAFTWVDRADDTGSQQCRQDLLTYFTTASPDNSGPNSQVASSLKYDPGSCHTNIEGINEMEIFWRAGFFTKDVVNNVFVATVPGYIKPDWTAVGLKDYDQAFATASPPLTLGPWTAVADLEAAYYNQKVKLSDGPLITLLKSAPLDVQEAALQLAQQALLARQDTAKTWWGGNMSPPQAAMYIYVRFLVGELKAVIPGLPAETLTSPAGAAMVDVPPSTRSRVGRANSDGLGIMELPIYDGNGTYRFLVCGTGIMEDGARASYMAVQSFTDSTWCLGPSPFSSGTDTQVKFSKFSNDQEQADSISASLEIKANIAGVAVGAGAKYSLDSQSSSQSVYVTAMASKLQQPPLSLPSSFPPLTNQSITLLQRFGRKTFTTKYGTHFVFGFRLGGYLNFAFQYVANQLLTKQQISAQLSGKSEGALTDASASADIKSSMTSKSVNVVSSVRTNTYLPEDTCGTLVINTEFDPDGVKACISEWLKYPAEAAYGAYAVPFEFHPDFQANLPAWESDPPTPTISLTAVTEGQFRDTGMLGVRLQRIDKSLDSYPFKEDAFYAKVYTTIAQAKTQVKTILDGLRDGSITTTAAWQDLYRGAVGLVDLASSQSNFVPKGARCGWCLTPTQENREGTCFSRCANSGSCTLYCNDTTAATTPCSYKGFIYETVTDSFGNISPYCMSSVTGPTCQIFGYFGQTGGAMYCKQTSCAWATEYCDGDVEKDPTGTTWGCLGNCQKRTGSYYTAGGCSSTQYPTYDNIVDDKFALGGWAPKELYYEQVNNVWQPKLYWNSLADVEGAFPDLRLNSTNGISRATTLFLTTNCPSMAPINVWNSTAWPPSTSFPPPGNAGVTVYQPLICLCSDTQTAWLPKLSP